MPTCENDVQVARGSYIGLEVGGGGPGGAL